MEDHDQSKINAIFARSLRKHIAVEPVQSSFLSVSPLEILDDIQPSLSRQYPTAHLENILKLRQNKESSQTATDAVDSPFREHATEQHARVVLCEPSTFQQRTTFVSDLDKPRGYDGKSSIYPNPIKHRSSLPSGDLCKLDDASLSLMLAQQLEYEDDHAIEYTTEESSSLTQDYVTPGSSESMSSSKGIQTLPETLSPVHNQSSGFHNQLQQYQASTKLQDSVATFHPICADQPTGAKDLSEPTGKGETCTKAKDRTSQEQALKDKEDARAEREMQDMDSEYHATMETRRQNLAKMERDAEEKRSMASAAEARRIVESKVAVKSGLNSKYRRTLGGSSVLAPTICEEISDIGKQSTVAHTRPTYPPNRTVSQAGNAAPPYGATHDTTMGSPLKQSNTRRHNGNSAENQKTEQANFNSLNDPGKKLRYAAYLIRKRMQASEHDQDQAKPILTAKSQDNSHESSLLLDVPQSWVDENTFAPSISTQSPLTVPDSVIIFEDATAGLNLTQSHQVTKDEKSQRRPNVAESTLQKLVNPGRTSFKPENKIGVNGVGSNVQPEILTTRKAVNAEIISRVGEHTSDSTTSPKVLDKHDNDPTNSAYSEESNSLFGDNHSDTETHGDVTEPCQLPQSHMEVEVGRTAIQESQQRSTIIGQWAFVKPDNNEDDANQPSVKDSENFLRMQMHDIESKKPHTRTISTRDSAQKHVPNKRQKFEIHASGLTRSKPESTHPTNSKLVDRHTQLEAVEPCTSTQRRRTRMTTPERKAAKRCAALKHQRKKKLEELQQGSKRSHQSTPESIESVPMTLHAISSGPGRPQTKGRPQARGFAALNYATEKKSKNGTGKKTCSGVEKTRYTSVQESRQNMCLSDDERIDAITYQLPEHNSDIRDVEGLENSQFDTDIRSFGQQAASVSHAYESPSSSDEDEEEEHAQQRRLLRRSSPAVPPTPVPEPLDIRRSTYARKGIARKTIEHKEDVNNSGSEDESSNADSEQCEDSTDPASDVADEDILWHYLVTRKTQQSDDPDGEFLEEPCGTFFYTKEEANKVANASLHALLQDAPLENAVTMSTDPLGLLTCHFQTPSTHIIFAVSRAIQRTARLPRSAARLPALVYAVHHRVIQRHRAKTVPDTYSYLPVGIFSVLDLANREAGRAWLAHELRELPDVPYSREIVRPQRENAMRARLDALEAEGGFFRDMGRYVRGEGEVEMEVEVWVGEQEVKGPRN
ncbi:hypothetical protein MMC11_008232 [Xylographa trunciseda]|nr:hypothetical protein [Xylographa trunciseda]